MLSILRRAVVASYGKIIMIRAFAGVGIADLSSDSVLGDDSFEVLAFPTAIGNIFVRLRVDIIIDHGGYNLLCLPCNLLGIFITAIRQNAVSYQPLFQVAKHLHLSTPPPLPLPLPAVPRGKPLPLGIPLALPAPAVPRVVRDGAGVEYFEEILEEVGGCSTKDVSVVL
jgi:hypothetical protein